MTPLREGMLRLTYTDDNGDEATFDVPYKNEVCDDCGGEGRTLNENIRQHAYSQEEFAEAFDDDESREEYFKGGRGIYGVPCKTCNGNKVVRVPCAEYANAETKALLVKWQEQEEDDARERAAERRTYRMESGDWS